MASPEFHRMVERMRTRATAAGASQPTIDQLREAMEEVGRKFAPPPGVTFSQVDAAGVPAE